jgi:type IV pilus assembly protein PilV
MQTIRQNPGHARQRGVSLIEVLTSMLVLAVGMLGMIAVQTNATRFLQTSHSQGTAAMLAYDIGDRMRANTPEVTSNTYNHTYNSASTSESSVTDCTSNACSSAELAAFDVDEWQTLLSDNLPASRASIARTATAGTGGATTDDFLISVHWDDDRSGSTGTECDPADKTSDDLDCWQITVSF